MQMKKCAICSIALTMMASQAGAIDMATYAQLKEASEDSMQIYITGIGEGILAANQQLISKDRRPLYCQPGQLSLNTKNYGDIFEKQLDIIERMLEKAGKKSELSTWPVALILVLGLVETFPCK